LDGGGQLYVEATKGHTQGLMDLFLHAKLDALMSHYCEFFFLVEVAINREMPMMALSILKLYGSILN